MPDSGMDSNEAGENFLKDETYVPSSRETFTVFQAVLQNWARLSADYIGFPVEGPSVMSLERSVHLSGTFQGFFVVRAHRKFAKLLLEKTAVHAVVPSSGEEAFDQLAEKFSAEMVKSYWNPWDFKPFLINPCNPRFWPGRAPASACALLVERYPIEIRLWIETGFSPSAAAAAGEETA